MRRVRHFGTKEIKDCSTATAIFFDHRLFEAWQHLATEVKPKAEGLGRAGKGWEGLGRAGKG